MTNDGLKVEVNEKKFKSMPQEERDWMLFQAVTYLNGHGCSWAKNKFKVLSVKTVAAAFTGGFTAIIAKAAFWK